MNVISFFRAPVFHAPDESFDLIVIVIEFVPPNPSVPAAYKKALYSIWFSDSPALNLSPTLPVWSTILPFPLNIIERFELEVVSRLILSPVLELLKVNLPPVRTKEFSLNSIKSLYKPVL